MKLIDDMYNDVPHVNVTNDIAMSEFFPQSRHRVTLRTCDGDQSTGDMIDQTTPLLTNKGILVDSDLSSSKSCACLSI